MHVHANDAVHVPVLVEEVVTFIARNPDGIYVDGTLGAGGHTARILSNLSPAGRVIGIDVDEQIIDIARRHCAAYQDRFIILKGNFSEMKNLLASIQVSQVDGILLDLGVSSYQLDSIERGFSFRGDARLDMRMDRSSTLTADLILNTYDSSQLERLFFEYGEERHSKPIVRKIMRERQTGRIESTLQLKNIIEAAVGKRFVTKTLARIFQALRIEVNNEMVVLRSVLRDSSDLLRRAGRIAVISYHSLEDRIVKHAFRDMSHGAEPLMRIITGKPVEASSEEMLRNPRSRSAKLRVAERV